MTPPLLAFRPPVPPWPAFTLVEAAIVLAIVAVVAAIALPRYAGFVAQEKVQAAARRIVTDLALAQRQARLTSAGQRVVFDAVTHSYAFPNLSDPDRKSQSYQVSLAADPYWAQIVTVTFGGDSEVRYDGYGEPDSNGSIVIAVGGYQRTITVDKGTGRARIIGPVGSEAAQ